MSVKRNFRETLLDGLEQLIREGSKKDFWVSTRSTSDALIALNICLPAGEFPKLRLSALQSLVKQGEKTSDGGLSWMEEIWDTSVAIMAIATEPVRFEKEILLARKWLYSKYLRSHNSWNDELWETLLALNAVSYLFKRIQKEEAGLIFF